MLTLSGLTVPRSPPSNFSLFARMRQLPLAGLVPGSLPLQGGLAVGFLGPKVGMAGVVLVVLGRVSWMVGVMVVVTGPARVTAGVVVVVPGLKTRTGGSRLVIVGRIEW
jgi:hypothetical protein